MKKEDKQDQKEQVKKGRKLMKYHRRLALKQNTNREK